MLNTRNHLTVCKQMSFNSFSCLQTIHLQITHTHTHIYDLVLNNHQGLICH